MKKKYVFDAGVLSLYFSGHSETKLYFDAVFKKQALGYVCEVNLAEYYYKAIKNFGITATEIRYTSLRNTLIVISPNENLTRLAARLKAKFITILSLADAYAIALNNVVRGMLLTTDKKLFELKITKAKLLEF